MRSCFKLAGVAVLAAATAGISLAAGPALRASAVVRADPATGRLIRTVVAPSARLAPESVNQLIEEAARKYDIDPLLVHSVIRAESNYNPFAVSGKGAQGLMQLIPATAERFNVTNSFDIRQNIDAGARYLKHLIETFGDERLAVAAYNAGEGAVERYHRKVPPFRETQEYVERVGRTYGNLRRDQDQRGEEGPSYRPLEAFIDQEGRLHLRTR